MKIYVLIHQKPLEVKTYSSLRALIEDNDVSAIGASRSKLEKFPFDRFDYVNSRYIISRSEPKTTGDVRRKSIQ
jgi:hypothetical protein